MNWSVMQSTGLWHMMGSNPWEMGVINVGVWFLGTPTFGVPKSAQTVRK